MSLSPELEKAYRDAAVPFIGGAITTREVAMKSWRYFLEISSACNLKCPTCTKGNMGEISGLKYEHQTGLMDMDLMEKILDKIASENPKALLMLYGNSEPLLHPKLPECVVAVRKRGLHAEISTNLNVLNRVDDLLASHPDQIIISLSGWTQEVYVKGHAGGNIEKVKAHMRVLAEANNQIPLPQRVKILVNFHVYKDNEHEIAPMNEYANNLGLGFFTSIARAISMENAVQYCRAHDPEATPYEIEEGRPDWNKVLPPMGEIYFDAMDRLRIPPTEAVKMYADIPVAAVCPVGAGGMFTFVRHDGLAQMCACTADRRITLGNYLDMSPDEMIEKRTGHAFCRQCLKARTNLYFHLAHPEKWVP